MILCYVDLQTIPALTVINLYVMSLNYILKQFKINCFNGVRIEYRIAVNNKLKLYFVFFNLFFQCKYKKKI